MFVPIIVSMILMYWLYQTSIQAGKNPWRCLAIGLAAYYLSMKVWNILVLEPIFGRSLYGHSTTIGLIHVLSSIAVGVVAVVFFRYKFIGKKVV